MIRFDRLGGSAQPTPVRADRLPKYWPRGSAARMSRYDGTGARWGIQTLAKGEIQMGDKGQKDKGGKEKRKKPQHTQKEKRQLKKEKKKNK